MPIFRHNKIGAAIVTAGLLAVSGCVTPQDLGGSVAERYSLAFADVRAYWVGAELVISFEKRHGLRHAGAFGSPVAHQVARLSFKSDRQELAENVDIPVAGPDVAAPFATVEHYAVTNADSGGLTQAAHFPAVAGGRVYFHAVGKQVDTRIAGEFDVEFADGTSLWGDFDTVIGEP